MTVPAATAASAQPPTAVMNPLSDLIVDLYGPDVGAHARTAIGVATVPLNLPVVIAAEVEIS
jgi:enamine deaminase RidA (YjgF/YER057c/UK114 family)